MREALLASTFAGGALFLAVWAVFRLFPSVPADVRAWIWRIAFLKPLLGLIPVAAITLAVLPARTEVPLVELPAANSLPRTLDRAESAGVQGAGSAFDLRWLVWAAGAGIVGARGVSDLLGAFRVAREARPVKDEAILGALEELKARANYRGTVRLLKSDAIASPMLLGGWRPTIVLPEAAASTGDRRLMLAHEIAHLARRDLYWFAEIWIVQAIFFFSPLVWLASHRSRLDHESATDRLACILAGAPVQTYAEMLVRATVVARPSLVPGLLPMAESYRTIHRRLEAMKHFDLEPSRPRRLAFAALAFAAACLLPSYQLAEASPAPAPHAKPMKRLTKPKATKKAAQRKTLQKKAVKPISKSSSEEKLSVSVVKTSTAVSKANGGSGNASVSGSVGRSVSGEASFATDPEAQKRMEKTVAEFKQAVEEQQKSLGTGMAQGGNATSQTAGPNQATAGGSASGNASGMATSRITRIVNGKEEVVQSGTTGDSASGSTSNGSTWSYSSGFGNPNGFGNGSFNNSFRSSGSIGGSTGPDGLKISFKFENYNAKEALQALFRQGNRKVKLEPGLNRQVTAVAKDLSFEEALKVLLKAANGTSHEENGTTVVSPKPKDKS